LRSCSTVTRAAAASASRRASAVGVKAISTSRLPVR
jgi:hypothetical protein